MLLTDDSIDVIAGDSELAKWFSDLAVVDTTELFRHSSEFTYALELFDGLTVIELNDERGFVPATVVTDDRAVLTWAEERFERYKRATEPLDPAEFAT